MTLVLHDLQDAAFSQLFPNLPKETAIISQGPTPIQKCVGCFSCWVKTPGSCVIRDGYGDYGGLIGSCTRYILISRIVYGGFSPFVKNILDRNIGYLMPYFTVREKHTHHVSRYPSRIRFAAIGYGRDITKGEKETFRGLVAANGLNLNARESRAFIADSVESIAKMEEIFS